MAEFSLTSTEVEELAGVMAEADYLMADVTIVVTEVGIDVKADGRWQLRKIGTRVPEPKEQA